MSHFKNFFFHGKEYFVDHEVTILDILTYFNYPSYLFVVEYNHKICDPNHWTNLFLQKEDRIEIITIVGGG